MPKVTVVYGEQERTVEAPLDGLVGEAIAETGLPLEQPCAGRGTCGLCKVLVETGLAPPDEVERRHLTPGELAVSNRLACRARLQGDARVVLAPIVVYSNKIFRASYRYKRVDTPLGLAIDLGTTTVAAFLTLLDDGKPQTSGEVCAGGASLNQQSVYGADVISRLKSAQESQVNANRLHNLALASINQAVDSLRLSERIRSRIIRVVVVGNVAMHHLLACLPVETLTAKPFQPIQKAAMHGMIGQLGSLFSEGVEISLPPLIGGFVGSDALACLAYFRFDQAPGPMVAVDLGTNGEVLVTDGITGHEGGFSRQSTGTPRQSPGSGRILVASTAAGPAFEGVFISCGTRAVDGAITAVHLENGDLAFDTIADEAPIGLTGSGLLSLVHRLRQAGVVEPNGRISPTPPLFGDRTATTDHGRRINLLQDPSATARPLYLTQWDIRELQKAKGAIRAAIDTLMAQLNLHPEDIQRLILTGSFGGQIDIDAAVDLGMIPPVPRERIETIANGAGLGAAMFLSDEGFALGEALAQKAEQVDLDLDPDFMKRYIEAMVLAPNHE